MSVLAVGSDKATSTRSDDSDESDPANFEKTPKGSGCISGTSPCLLRRDTTCPTLALGNRNIVLGENNEKMQVQVYFSPLRHVADYLLLLEYNHQFYKFS
jgi:hypothetical protein